jgi:hypothetical protein
LKLNDKLVLREKDEKGKFMIVKQGIKGNKNINENAYRLVYRIIRDFLSWKSLNSVNYNIETKELTYSDDQPNVETQQRNIQIDDISEVDSHKLKHYTQITGNYSKPNLAILTLGTDGKLNIAIYIPESLDNELIDNESIYYAMLIKEIQKLNKNPTFANLFKNVEKNYTFSENEPVYSVFEKLNDLTNKLENKHFNKLTVKYFNDILDNPILEEFEYLIETPKVDHNFKFLPFLSYLEGFIPTYNEEQIEETSLTFLLDLAIRRYRKVHDEFKEQFTPIEAGRETPAAAPAAEKAAPEAAPAATTQDKSLEIIREEIITKLQNIADSKGNTYPEQDQANVVRNLKELFENKDKYQEFKDKYSKAPYISQQQKNELDQLIEQYETLSSKTVQAPEAEQELINNLEGAVLTIKDKNVLNKSELTIELDRKNYMITGKADAEAKIDNDKITHISVKKPTTGTNEEYTMYIVLNNNISFIEVQGKIQEGYESQNEIKFTLSGPEIKTMDKLLSNSTENNYEERKKKLLKLNAQLNSILQIQRSSQSQALSNTTNTTTLQMNEPVLDDLEGIVKTLQSINSLMPPLDSESNGVKTQDTEQQQTLYQHAFEISEQMTDILTTILNLDENETEIKNKIGIENDLVKKSTELKNKIEELKGLKAESPEAEAEAFTNFSKFLSEVEKYLSNKIERKIQNLTPQTGGKLTKQLDELNYKLHITMYIQKLIRLMVYLYVLKQDDKLSVETFGIELVLNIVIFLAINNSSSEYMICYMIDTVVSMLSVYVYLHVCKKEKYTVNKNVVLGLVLSPYYLFCM